MDDGDVTLRQALRIHLAENGFPPDGGMSKKWEVVWAGPVPIGLPNIAARRRATPIHDLNHVVSGYGHDAMGEAENAAWELGGGCRDYVAAWVLNGGALGLGMARSPRRVFAAFVRGRQTRNLYGVETDAVIDLPLSVVRTMLGLDDEPAREHPRRSRHLHRDRRRGGDSRGGPVRRLRRHQPPVARRRCPSTTPHGRLDRDSLTTVRIETPCNRIRS